MKAKVIKIARAKPAAISPITISHLNSWASNYPTALKKFVSHSSLLTGKQNFYIIIIINKTKLQINLFV